MSGAAGASATERGSDPFSRRKSPGPTGEPSRAIAVRTPAIMSGGHLPLAVFEHEADLAFARLAVLLLRDGERGLLLLDLARLHRELRSGDVGDHAGLRLEVHRLH